MRDRSIARRAPTRPVREEVRARATEPAREGRRGVVIGDREGSFAIGGLPEGRFLLRVQSEGFAPVDPLAIEAGGDPRPGNRPGTPGAEVTTAADGAFFLGPLAAGAYELFYYFPGARPWRNLLKAAV